MATNPKSADIGLIGLAVMGENLVLNMESHGFTVAVFNRTTSKVDAFLEGRAKGKKIVGTHSVEELVAALKRPRKIMIMVKAGVAVDAVIDELVPLLEPGDILIDGGNSRIPRLDPTHPGAQGQGAALHRHRRLGRRGGGTQGPVDHARRQSRGLAARQADLPGHRRQGRRRHPVLRLGRPRGRRPFRQDGPQRHRVWRHAAHLRGLSPDARAAATWSPTRSTTSSPAGTQGPLDSYLIEITRDILGFKDPETGKPMIDLILDAAGQKGTGKWTVISACHLGVPLTLIAEAVFARCLSAQKDERVAASKVLKGPEASSPVERDDPGRTTSSTPSTPARSSPTPRASR